jgi:hypothetical protein
MREYSFTEARQNFAALLEEAKREGVVCIKNSSFGVQSTHWGRLRGLGCMGKTL